MNNTITLPTFGEEVHRLYRKKEALSVVYAGETIELDTKTLILAPYDLIADEGDFSSWGFPVYPQQECYVTAKHPSFDYDCPKWKIALSHEVTKALIDAVKNPTCPACGDKIHNKFISFLTQAHCSKCNRFGAEVNLFIGIEWIEKQQNLIRIAELRSPAVMWQWLESLRKTNE